MAYEQVVGTIEAIARTGKQVKLDDGEWYSAFAATQLQGAEVGDTISFNMEPKDQGDKTFYNIKGDVSFENTGEGSPRESAGASARGRTARPAARAAAPAPRRGSAPAAARSERGGAGVVTTGSDPRQTSIIRQNSLTQANNLIGNSDALKADLQELDGPAAAEFVIEIARVFEAYSSAQD